MTPLASALRRISGRLERESADFALVGGLAVSARTEPRFTRDIDLAVATKTDEDAEGLIRALMHDGWAVEAISEQGAVDRLATVRLRPPQDLDTAAVVDLLFASSGIEAELVHDAETLEVLPDVVAPVATTAALMVLKALAAGPERPQDEVDLAALIAVATEHERKRARQLATLVVERGFHRDRDLVAELDERFR
jgi:hypothetical protein